MARFSFALEGINIQPNFSKVLNMESLSLHDTCESEDSENFAISIAVQPKISRPTLSKLFDAHSVKRNPDLFKPSRDKVTRSASCEVPDSLLQARAARIILSRGKSHRPPPTRYVRRQRSALDPIMRTIECDNDEGIEMSVIVPSSQPLEKDENQWVTRMER
jgi:hypothetical protein